MPDTPRWLDKTWDTLKKATEAGQDMVSRNVQKATLKVELGALRRSLDDVARDIGRVAVDRLRESGQLTADEVSHLLRRVDELDDQVAAKEKLVADIETQESAPGTSGTAGAGASSTDTPPSGGRPKRPGFTGKGSDTPT